MEFTPGVWRYAGPPLVLAVPFLVVWPPVSLVAVVLSMAVLWFHRDPARTPPGAGIVSPADGKVSVVRTENGRVRVGVFMNVTDVHVNRMPLDGTVASVTHEPGANRPAFSKDSDRNERVRVDCDEFEVVLIAGWFARRIHPYVEPGDELDRGERLGHISFGSRADVLLPESLTEADVAVELGDRVTAGETVIAREAWE